MFMAGPGLMKRKAEKWYCDVRMLMFNVAFSISSITEGFLVIEINQQLANHLSNYVLFKVQRFYRYQSKAFKAFYTIIIRPPSIIVQLSPGPKLMRNLPHRNDRL